MAKILVVDDDRDILNLIENVLSKSDHTIKKIIDPMDVLKENLNYYDLILLDVMMPQLNGFELCKKIRDMVDCPIIFLTAKTEEHAIIKGLGLGGDDYIMKPFVIQELRARVNAHLRRDKRKKNHAFVVGKIRFIMDSKECYIEDAKINLTKSEYGISEMLAFKNGQVFSKEQIYESVFGCDGESDNNVIVEHIKNIRNKFKIKSEEPIKTVWGIGYKWES